jgi:endoglucanase
VNGSDYTVSGGTLTLKAALLSRLTATATYGVNATLRVNFSAGMPWKVFVRVIDTPVMSNVTGGNSGLPIPTQYNGDVVATMESRYSDGTNAGPTGWTPYQEYDYSYSPSYPAGTFTLTSTYLNSLADSRPVTITVDFWSGAKITYNVVKSGTTVTGTA